MAQSLLTEQPRAAEAELVRRAVGKDEAAIRSIIQTNNRRLYRVARSVVRDDSEAEDVVQEAYLRAFSALPEFRGEFKSCNLAHPDRVQRGPTEAAPARRTARGPTKSAAGDTVSGHTLPIRRTSNRGP